MPPRADRVAYGSNLIKGLAAERQPQFGSGLSGRQLKRCRQFYCIFPIASAVRTQLSWTHYKTLISLGSSDKREFYVAEAAKNNWSARQQCLHLDGDDFFVNLVFYNWLLQCFVLVEIKTDKLTHQDLG